MSCDTKSFLLTKIFWSIYIWENHYNHFFFNFFSQIVVIEAIRSLCIRYPRKHATLMNFLAQMLRDEGGFEYKKAIVDTIICIVEDNPAAKDLGLSHLCEFIEDCEHAALATRVLHLLGREGPTTNNPARYIRFIYNRVILESTQVGNF